MTKMTQLESHFCRKRIEQGVSELASQNACPGEFELQRVFAKARRCLDFPEADQKKYPETEALAPFSRYLCDLRVSPDVWAEFKHGTSREYISKIDNTQQGTTKDIFRNTCMDITKSQLVSLHPGHLGRSIVSILHLGFDKEKSSNRLKVALSALAEATRVNMELHDFQYNHSNNGTEYHGFLSIFLFSKSE